MIYDGFMYGITGRSCTESNSDSLTKSVEKSNDDSYVFLCCGSKSQMCARFEPNGVKNTAGSITILLLMQHTATYA